MKADTAHVTGRNYRKPRRPLLVKTYNALGKLGQFLGLKRKIEAESLMQKAVRSTGLSEFGSDFDREPLDVLCTSIEEESQLHPFGRFVTRTRLRGVLENRLRAEFWFRECPEIDEISLPPVCVITGLQRTGTTMLHRLLSADPDTRALLSWEAINPAPIPGLEKEKDRHKRIGSALTSQKALGYIAPDFFTVHPVEAMAPEEDCLLLDAAFLSTVPEATLRVPTYSRWLESRDQRPAYEYMKRLLKLLHWQDPGKRWILKTPHHMEYLDVLFEVFPDAKIIQTHRDPAVTIASFCSMISHGRGVFSDKVDPLEVGRDWTRKIVRMTENTMRVRDNMPNNRFLDIYYEDLLDDPIEEVRKIYDYLNIPWNETLELVMRKNHRENYQYKYGKHLYTLEDFNFTEQGIRGMFEEYYHRYIDSGETRRRRA